MDIINITSPQAQTIALQVLRAGGLVICPTETVYGALVDATNPAAVQKLLRYKHRPLGKPISIACCDQKMAAQYVNINQQADKIYHSLLPGPVTVISISANRVASGVASENNTLGIRIPAHPFLLDLVKKIGSPLTATSANSSGKKAPYSISDLLDHLSNQQKNQIDLILDGGTLPKNPPSIVIDTTTDSPTVLRPNSQVNFQSSASSATSIHNFLSHSPTETGSFAQKIITSHFDTLQKQGLFIALDGPLGAGKTAFTQGLAKALNISTLITSPTYTYLKEYPFQISDFTGTLYHFDFWTLQDPAILKLFEIDKLSLPGNLLIMEWYDNVKQFLSPSLPTLHFTFQETHQPEERQITYTDLRKGTLSL